MTLAPVRRYTPTGDAQATGLLRVLEKPSFLGTGNRYLLAALEAYPDLLRRIVVVDALCATEEPQWVKSAGIICPHHSLFGQDLRMLEVNFSAI